MPNNIPNDDLTTEVLNHDPSYVKERSQQGHDLNAKHSVKFNSSSSFNWLIAFQKAKYAIPIGILVVLGMITVVFWQSLDLGRTNQNLTAKQSNESSIIDSSSASSNKFIQPKNTPDLAAPALIETNVISSDGSEINFKYDSKLETISYTGRILIPDGCTSLASSSLEAVNSSFTLKYQLKRFGEMCIQVVGVAPLTGNFKSKLDPQQIQNFDKLFKIERDLQ